MSRNVVTFVIAGSALGLGGVASAETAPALDLNRSYAAQLAADAQARTSAQASDDAGFTLTNGQSSLNIGGLFEFRYLANFSDEDAMLVGADNEFGHGFEITRARLDFQGTAYNERVKFRVSGDFGEINTGGGNAFTVTFAYGEYAFTGALEGVSVRFGQFKLPLLYEELVAPEYQLAADRSVTNEFFSQQYSQGLQFTYETDTFRGAVAVSDGLSSQNTSFAAPGEADAAFTGRLDYKVAGQWEQFDDFSSFRGSDQAIRVGGAVHYELFGYTNPSNTGAGASGLTTGGGAGEGNFLVFTLDGQYEANGLGLYAAFIGSYVDAETNLTGTSQEYGDYGVVLQGSYFVTDEVELFARYDVLLLDDARPGISEDAFNFITFGGTYYVVPNSHAAKLTTDVVVAINDTNELAGVSPAGAGTGPNLLASPVTGLFAQDSEGQFVVRAQLSLVF